MFLNKDRYSNSMSEKEFLEKQSRILSEIETTGENVREGLEINGKKGLISKLPEEGLEERGYIVYLSYSNGSCERLSSFSRSLLETIDDSSRKYKGCKPNKIIVYKPEFFNVHTTLGIYSKRKVEKDIDDVDLGLIVKLGKAVFNLFSEQLNLSKEERIKKPEIYFDKFIHDQSTIIARPIVSRNFYSWMEMIKENANKLDIKLDIPWGSHITVARFKEDIPYEKMDLFNNLMNKTSMNFDPAVSNWDIVHALDNYGTSQPSPISIEVGTYCFDNKDFILDPSFSYKLNKF